MKIKSYKSGKKFYESIEYALAGGFVLLLLWPVKGVMGSLESFEKQGYSAPISYVTNSFQDAFPIVATLLSILVALYAAWRLAYLSGKMRLYDERNALPFFIFILTLVSIVGTEDMLTTAIIALLSGNALISALRSFQPTNQNEALFSGGFSLGLLPLIYPPSIALWAMAPLTIIIFSRTLRESIIYIIGLLIPTLALIYVNWLAGYNFLTPITGFIEAVNFDVQGGLDNIHGWYSWFVIALIGAVLLLSIIFMGEIAERRRSKIRLFYAMLWLAVAIFSLYAASTTTVAVALVAPAVALLMPISLLALPERYAKWVFYLIIILGLVGAVV